MTSLFDAILDGICRYEEKYGEPPKFLHCANIDLTILARECMDRRPFKPRDTGDQIKTFRGIEIVVDKTNYCYVESFLFRLHESRDLGLEGPDVYEVVVSVDKEEYLSEREAV